MFRPPPVRIHGIDDRGGVPVTGERGEGVEIHLFTPSPPHLSPRTEVCTSAKKLPSRPEAPLANSSPEVPQPPEVPDIKRRIQLHPWQWIGIPLFLLIPILALFGVFGET